MKKPYETPTVEMIAFRYRDQVVAASGDTGGNTGGNSQSGGEQFIDWLAQSLGISECKGYECSSLANL